MLYWTIFQLFIVVCATNEQPCKLIELDYGTRYTKCHPTELNKNGIAEWKDYTKCQPCCEDFDCVVDWSESHDRLESFHCKQQKPPQSKDGWKN